MNKAGVGLLFSVLVLMAASCGGDDRDQVLVLAAASLSDSFQEIETAFERANPTVDIRLSFAGSGSLREQILQGAPADVFASANQATMQAVIDEEAATEAQPFVRNTLQIAVPTGNPGSVAGIADLADGDLLVGLCAEAVPCGDFARQALQQADVEPAIDTNEADVRALLTKLAADELDVGIVYATDVLASPEVIGIDLPLDITVDITYPIAVLRDAPNAGGAQAFVDFVRSSQGTTIMQTHGFQAP